MFREHGRFVFRVLRRLGVPDEALDDAVQEVFLVAHRRFDRYDPDAPIRSWLFGISRRVASHQRRGAQREARRRDQADAPNPAPDPERAAAGGEAASFVQGFLANLEESKRLVFWMCEVEGMTAPEVGVALDLNVNTVYSRLRLARQQFERALANYRGAEG